jgi:3-dehydroquinate dehydratase
MKGDVGIKLACMANKEENFFDFIRNSEKEFGLLEKDVFSLSLGQLNTYIDDLSYLWDK